MERLKLSVGARVIAMSSYAGTLRYIGKPEVVRVLLALLCGLSAPRRCTLLRCTPRGLLRRRPRFSALLPFSMTLMCSKWMWGGV
jgi:hypothetical protein